MMGVLSYASLDDGTSFGVGFPPVTICCDLIIDMCGAKHDTAYSQGRELSTRTRGENCRRR